MALVDFSLWDHQLKMYHAARASIARGNKRIVVYGPTGCGKSRTMAAMIGQALEKEKKAGFYVNRKSLTDQFGKTLQSFKITYDILQGENTCITGENVQVCTIQTVARRGWFNADVIFIDECHYVPGSKEYLRMIYGNKDKIIIGFTATPFAHGMAACHDELDGEPLFQDLIVETDVQHLISEGVLVDVDIYAPSSPDMEGVKVGRNQFGEAEYNQQQTEERVNKIELIGDIFDHWKRYASNMKTIGFAHSQSLTPRRLVKCFKKEALHADISIPTWRMMTRRRWCASI
jgi:superfamily II DNA or RNA helicase